MTREEHKKAIIENLNTMVDKLEDDTEYFDALYHLDMLCKEAEPCEDCISRQAVLDAIEDDSRNGHYSCFASNNDAQCFKGVIDELPSVKPQVICPSHGIDCEDCPAYEPKTGHWRAVYQGNEIINYRCTECEVGNTFGRNTYRMNYCPNCGAKMVEPQESEDKE